MPIPRLAEYAQIQQSARAVLLEVRQSISGMDCEGTVAARVASSFAARGIQSTWYHDCLALVLAGSRTCVSVSGREYTPSHDLIGDNSLITVDVSPLSGDIWGDCARSFCVENGQVVDAPQDSELAEGMAAESALHCRLLETAHPKMTFDQLYGAMHELLVRMGYENLDFRGNLGHTIGSRPGVRRYIQPGNQDPICSTHLFTFEPHIRHIHGSWGFKHENIYYFGDDERLREL